MRWGILVLMMLLPVTGFGAVFKCHVNGHVAYMDHPCTQQGRQIHVDTITPGSNTGSAGAEIQSLAQSWHKDLKRKQEERRAAKRRAAAAEVRHVRGVTCPPNDAIKEAVQKQKVAICMTPQEVMEAEPIDRQEPSVHHRLLPTGPSVVEWVYYPVESGWPAVIRFDDNHVIGFTFDLPDYYYH